MTLIELVERLIRLLQLAIAWYKIRHAQNKRASSLVLQCDKTRQAFENKKQEMQKTLAEGECFLHFSSVLKCPECFITV